MSGRIAKADALPSEHAGKHLMFHHKADVTALDIDTTHLVGASENTA